MTQTIEDDRRPSFRNRRLSRGWSQAELAEQCAKAGVSVSDSQLSKIERGLWSPRPRLRAVLARLLDLPITYFDDREDVPA